MKRVIVFSLGGSLIIPEDIDIKYLLGLKKTILKHASKGKNKFVFVCGGGSISRKYINALRKARINETFQGYAGISSTRTNARFMNYLFNKDPEKGIPSTLATLGEYLTKHDVVFCGALEYKPNQTSDSTAAQIAKHFNSEFINLTNIPGLFNKNPLEHKDARFIPKIGWKEFSIMANKLKYKPGQHFVLDQKAAEIIMKHKIPTYILGKDLKQLDNFLNGKKFKGTTIEG